MTAERQLIITSKALQVSQNDDTSCIQHLCLFRLACRCLPTKEEGSQDEGKELSKRHMHLHFILQQGAGKVHSKYAPDVCQIHTSSKQAISEV